jgi:hypothetical protein
MQIIPTLQNWWILIVRVHLAWVIIELTTLVVIGTSCIRCCFVDTKDIGLFKNLPH